MSGYYYHHNLQNSCYFIMFGRFHIKYYFFTSCKNLVCGHLLDIYLIYYYLIKPFDQA